MNLKEGLRRIGAVIGWGTFFAAGGIYGLDIPSRDSLNYKYKDLLTTSIYAEQSQEYRANYREYQMVEAIWPSTAPEKIIESACAKNTTPERLAICSEHGQRIKHLWLDWVKHIFSTLGVALACSAIAGLLWRALSWVLLGFTQPKESHPKS